MCSLNFQSIGLYIHWPFCIKKCYYCDLNSHVRNYDHYENFAKALVKELKNWRENLPTTCIESVFFGGGTPSLMQKEWIAELIQEVRDWNASVDFRRPLEITLEANPTTTECLDLLGFYQAGINRMSFGVQTFDDDQLLRLGRSHTGDQARSIIMEAQRIFPQVSLDLMYNLPKQNLIDLENDLNSAIDLNIKHISYYALTIHANTAFGELYREQKLPLPSEDLFCDSYNLITAKLKQYGMTQYEISNFCFTGHESKHNLIYWKYRSFLGIGPGAHSRLFRNGTVEAIDNHKIPEKWLESIENNKISYNIEYLNEEAQKKEELLMKLRLSQGLNREEIVRLLPLNVWEKARDIVNLGDMWINGDSFGITNSGFLKYNAIFRYINKS